MQIGWHRLLHLVHCYCLLNVVDACMRHHDDGCMLVASPSLLIFFIGVEVELLQSAVSPCIAIPPCAHTLTLTLTLYSSPCTSHICLDADVEVGLWRAEATI